jgi:hypothetical protein
MIDWLVLLVPLAALPVVLVFVFVGCPLDREGIPGVRLKIPAASSLNAVTGISATVTVTGAEGDSREDSAAMTSPFPPEADFMDFDIDLEAIDAEEEGAADCECTISIVGTPQPPLKAHHDSPTEGFVLTVTGSGVTIDDFHLT